MRTLAEILHLTHRWDDFARVTNAIRRAPDAHDDVELLIHDARWQKREDWGGTLAATLHCAASAEAPSRHRIRSATLALKIATNLGDLAAIRRARHAISDVLESQTPPSPDQLAFEMIHAAVDGCGDEAARHARALLDQLTRSPSDDRLRLMLNCAVALARGGAIEEADKVCEHVYMMSPTFGLPRLAADACRRGALAMLDHGRFEGARSWVRRMEQGGFVALPAGHQAALRVVHAKIALFDGEPEAALALLERHGEQCACEGIPMLDAAVLAVRIVANIMLRSDAEQITEDVCALEALEERLVPLGGQDYEAVALAAGRAYLGQAEDGVAFFSTYLEERRRDAYPFPDSLAGMLDTLLATAVS